jgi:hypothetical protein
MLATPLRPRMDRSSYALCKEGAQVLVAFEARERATHFARADNWQLVLQFDGGFVAEYAWDFRFYVCNRKSDLAERRFDRCWTVMQCT